METTDFAPGRAPGEILRDLRKVLAPEGARTLTQARLAERLGYNEEYVQAMETGRRPMQPHFVDELARLADETRFPEAFARLVEELRSAVAAYWAARASAPPEIGGAPHPAGASDKPGSALVEALADKLDGKLDGLRGSVDGLSARTEGRLDGLGGKLERTEGTLAVLGNKLDTTVARTEAALGALGGKVEGAATRTGEQLHELAAKVAEVGDKSDRTDGKVAATRVQLAQTEKKVTRRLDLSIGLLCANFAMGLAGLAALFVFHCQHVPSAPQPALQEPPTVERESAPEEPEEEGLTSALDGGTELARLVKQATPMTRRALPEQRAAPCPEGVDEFNGYCWLRADFTPARVKAGACEDKALYEPSPGWCREHRAGYRPYRGARQNNSVEPE